MTIATEVTWWQAALFVLAVLVLFRVALTILGWFLAAVLEVVLWVADVLQEAHYNRRK